MATPLYIDMYGNIPKTGYIPPMPPQTPGYFGRTAPNVYANQPQVAQPVAPTPVPKPLGPSAQQTAAQAAMRAQQAALGNMAAANIGPGGTGGAAVMSGTVTPTQSIVATSAQPIPGTQTTGSAAAPAPTTAAPAAARVAGQTVRRVVPYLAAANEAVKTAEDVFVPGMTAGDQALRVGEGGARIGGAALGAKLGAAAGAMTGPAAPVLAPVGAVAGGIGGYFMPEIARKGYEKVSELLGQTPEKVQLPSERAAELRPTIMPTAAIPSQETPAQVVSPTVAQPTAAEQAAVFAQEPAAAFSRQLTPGGVRYADDKGNFLEGRGTGGGAFSVVPGRSVADIEKDIAAIRDLRNARRAVEGSPPVGQRRTGPAVGMEGTPFGLAEDRNTRVDPPDYAAMVRRPGGAAAAKLMQEQQLIAMKPQELAIEQQKADAATMAAQNREALSPKDMLGLDLQARKLGLDMQENQRRTARDEVYDRTQGRKQSLEEQKQLQTEVTDAFASSMLPASLIGQAQQSVFADAKRYGLPPAVLESIYADTLIQPGGEEISEVLNNPVKYKDQLADAKARVSQAYQQTLRQYIGGAQ